MIRSRRKNWEGNVETVCITRPWSSEMTTPTAKSKGRGDAARSGWRQQRVVMILSERSDRIRNGMIPGFRRQSPSVWQFADTRVYDKSANTGSPTYSIETGSWRKFGFQYGSYPRHKKTFDQLSLEKYSFSRELSLLNYVIVDLESSVGFLPYHCTPDSFPNNRPFPEKPQTSVSLPQLFWLMTTRIGRRRCCAKRCGVWDSYEYQIGNMNYNNKINQYLKISQNGWGAELNHRLETESKEKTRECLWRCQSLAQ